MTPFSESLENSFSTSLMIGWISESSVLDLRSNPLFMRNGLMRTLLYKNIPIIRTVNPVIWINVRLERCSQPIAKLNIQITKVRIESNTVLVVADNCLVTLIPAKLKNDILMIVPEVKKTEFSNFKHLRARMWGWDLLGRTTLPNCWLSDRSRRSRPPSVHKG